MEPSAIIAILITTLIAAVGFLVAGWIKNFETKIIAQDDRLREHDAKHERHEVRHATIVATLENQSDKLNEAHDKLDRLIGYANGNSGRRNKTGD